MYRNAPQPCYGRLSSNLLWWPVRRLLRSLPFSRRLEAAHNHAHPEPSATTPTTSAAQLPFAMDTATAANAAITKSVLVASKDYAGHHVEAPVLRSVVGLACLARASLVSYSLAQSRGRRRLIKSAASVHYSGRVNPGEQRFQCRVWSTSTRLPAGVVARVEPSLVFPACPVRGTHGRSRPVFRWAVPSFGSRTRSRHPVRPALLPPLGSVPGMRCNASPSAVRTFGRTVRRRCRIPCSAETNWPMPKVWLAIASSAVLMVVVSFVSADALRASVLCARAFLRVWSGSRRCGDPRRCGGAVVAVQIPCRA